MEKNNPSNFINYIKKPLNKESIDKLYLDNNVIYERSIIYQDFTLSLIGLVCDTYMGDNITDNDQKINHFNWCWDKTIENFNTEGINFNGNEELYDYFADFMVETFYTSSRKSNKLRFNLLKLWSYLFGFTMEKTRSDVDSFIEVYQLFDISIKKTYKKIV